MAYSPRERGAKCDECPFKGRPFAPPDTKKALLTVLSKHPGDEEIEKQRILVGPTGRRVRGALERVGAAIHAITFNNLCLCRPPEKAGKLTSKAIDCCRPRLANDLHETGSKVILAADRKAVAMLTGKLKEDDWMGAPLAGALMPANKKEKQPLWTGTVLPSFQPAQIFHSPQLSPVFDVHCDRAWRLARGTLPPWEWPTVEHGEKGLRLLERGKGILSIDIETSARADALYSIALYAPPLAHVATGGDRGGFEVERGDSLGVVRRIVRRPPGGGGG